MDVNNLRLDIAKRGKKGLHFIIASVLIWIAVLTIWSLPIEDVYFKNLLTFIATTPMVPLAFIISKMIRAEFSSKSNPLNQLGLLFSLNQFLYILIAMWVYQAVPDKMVMVLAVIFGAHLLPFGWLYCSKAYTIMAIVISVSMIILGALYSAVVIASTMIVFEIVFSIWLFIELRTLQESSV